MEIKWVGKDKETLIVRICRMRLNLHLILLEQDPVLAILQARLHKNAVEVSGEVLAADDLPNEVHLRFEIGLCAQLIAKLLHLVDLLLLQVLESLLFALEHGVHRRSRSRSVPVPSVSAIIVALRQGRPSTSPVPVV